MGDVSTAEPRIQFAESPDGCHVAYRDQGHGSVVIEVPHVQMSHIGEEWRIDAVREWTARITRSQRLVKFDNHGGGLSERRCGDFSLRTLSADIGAVADAAGAAQFALYGHITGSMAAVDYAARHPERVTHLVLWNGFARDADHGQNPRMQALFRLAASDWEMFTESISQAALGWEDAEAARSWAAVLRAAGTQESFLRYLEARRKWDVLDLLPSLTMPTLILADRRNQLANEASSLELASHISNAEMLTVASNAGIPGKEGVQQILAFLKGGVAPAPSVADLTPRESEILSLLATGAGNDAIANELVVSVNTVTRHLTHIYAKTGCKGRSEAILFAIEHGLGQHRRES